MTAQIIQFAPREAPDTAPCEMPPPLTAAEERLLEDVRKAMRWSGGVDDLEVPE